MTSDEKRRRKPGMCWSCASRRPVRLRTFWIDGRRKYLCASCERDYSYGQLCTGAATPPHDKETFG